MQQILCTCDEPAEVPESYQYGHGEGAQVVLHVTHVHVAHVHDFQPDRYDLKQER